MEKQRVLFTDRLLQSYLGKTRTKKEYRRDLNVPGFVLRLATSGSVTFVHVFNFAGKRKEFVIGHYPALALIDARKLYRENLILLERGIDPASVAVVQDVQELTVARLIDKYIINQCTPNLTTRTTHENKRILNRYILPSMGHLPADAIKRQQAVLLIEGFAVKTPGAARGAAKVARAMYSWALDRELVETNPFAGVSRSVQLIKPKSRKRVLTEEELRIVLPAFLGLNNEKCRNELTKRLLALVIVTGQRPGEVADLQFSEIDDDWWVLSDKKTKNRIEHWVYLTPLAKKIIGKPFHPKYRGTVFPGNNKNMEPLLVASLSHYVRLNQALLGEGWTPHDLRRTCATGLSRLGCNDNIIDAILNHAKQGIISVYNRNEYKEEKKYWLEKWSDYLEGLLF